MEATELGLARLAFSVMIFVFVALRPTTRMSVVDESDKYDEQEFGPDRAIILGFSFLMGLFVTYFGGPLIAGLLVSMGVILDL